MEQSNPNPMINSVILKKIFELLPITDLESCRLVCKTWFEESLTRWRRDMWLKLYEKDNSNSNDALTLAKFLNLNVGNNASISDPDTGTFKKFKLHRWNFDSGSVGKTKFWETCGPIMVQLEIEQCLFTSLKDFEAVVFQPRPKLKSLALNGNTYKIQKEQVNVSEGISHVLARAKKMESVESLRLNFYSVNSYAEFPMSFLEFFACYPNLKSLELIGFPVIPSDVFTFENLLTAMLNLLENGGYKWTIQELNILHVNKLPELAFEHIAILKQLNFPLTTLSLDIGTNTPPSDFKIILETYANTLRKLVVFRKAGRSIIPDVSHRDFPFGVRLEFLKELRLLGTAVTPNLNFLRFTPNLRSVYLVQETGCSMLNMDSYLSDPHLFRDLLNQQTELGWDYSSAVFPVANTDFSQLPRVSLPKMEEFVLSGKHDTVCSAEQVAPLGEMMPNLRKLRLGLDNDGFRVVCRAWKELELLIIQPCEVTNCGITGRIPGIQTQLPSLKDLTRLNYFAFGCETSRKSKVLDMDDSVEGIGTYKNLIEDTTAPPRAQITDEALQEFTSYVPHCKITRFNDGEEEWPDLQERYDEDYSSNGSESPSDFEEDMVNILKLNSEIIEQQRRRRENGGVEDSDYEWEDVEDDDEVE